MFWDSTSYRAERKANKINAGWVKLRQSSGVGRCVIIMLVNFFLREWSSLLCCMEQNFGQQRTRSRSACHWNAHTKMDVALQERVELGMDT